MKTTKRIPKKPVSRRHRISLTQAAVYIKKTRLTETTHVGKEHEFSQIVNGRVNPSTTLREKNTPRVRSDRHSVSIGDKLRLVVGEVFENEGREVSIFSESEQVLLMERVENTLLEIVKCQRGD